MRLYSVVTDIYTRMSVAQPTPRITPRSKVSSPCVVSFDFDDTLLLTDEIKTKALMEMCAKAHPGGIGLEVVKCVTYDARKAPPGKEVTPRTIFRAVAEGLLDLGVSPPDKSGTDNLNEIAQSWGESMCKEFVSILEDTLPKEAREMPGASAVLSYLFEHGIPCYINTASPQGLVDKVVDSLGWRPWLRDILGAPGSKHENLEKIVESEKLQNPCLQLIHVGDGDNDRRAAEEIGCIFVGVAPDGVAQFEGPSYVTVTDMYDALDKLCALFHIPVPPKSKLNQSDVLSLCQNVQQN